MKAWTKAYEQVVMLGDSITWSSGVPFGRRYGDFIEEHLQARLGRNVIVDVAVCGDGSDTVGQALARLDRDCLAYEPHIVLINLGANNLLREPDFIEPDLRNMINRIKARRPDAQVILETIPTLDEKRHAWRTNPEMIKAGGAERVLEVRSHAVIRRLAQEYGWPVHDRFQIYHQAIKIKPSLGEKLICQDGCHLTVPGNRYFARSAAALLAEYTIRPPLISKRTAVEWLTLAQQNPAFDQCCRSLQGGLALFLRTSGSWSRLMLQQSRSFARRAACMATHESLRSRASTVAALAAGFSALQRAGPCEVHQKPLDDNLNWLLEQVGPLMHHKLIKRLVTYVQTMRKDPTKI